LIINKKLLYFVKNDKSYNKLIISTTHDIAAYTNCELQNADSGMQELQKMQSIICKLMFPFVDR